MNSVDVREKLVEALRLDLVGPSENLGDPAEVLPQAPSRWYLTGFLVPLGAERSQRADEASTEDLDQAGEGGGIDDDVTPEPAAARQRYLPSSIGVSLLVPPGTGHLKITVSWGDYRRVSESPEEWARKARSVGVTVDLALATEKAREVDVPSSDGLRVAYLARPIGSVATDSGLPPGARTVSIFLVNRREPSPDEKKDEAFAFQVQLEVACEVVFLPRPDLRSHASRDWDDRVADLQYRDAGEFAVGHNVATEAVCPEGACSLVRTQWIPQAEVERVAPAAIPGVELSMDALSQLQSGADAAAKLGPLVSEYRKWIDGQAGKVPVAPAKRRETGLELIQRARVAADRIQRGIDLLGDGTCLEAFRLANKTMAEAARRRLGVMQGKRPEDVQPAWRPFQLAFLLMNLPGIAELGHPDRGIVDLLFFPTGGGKTEPVELTSRVSTSDVADAKRRLALLFSDKSRVDVAIATNMISVGLDITRLGLMVVFGQPKTSAEYIQATSRVGRDPDRPGLVVTIFNVHKPRDRSHYERFAAYHETFYRSVEATSVTPFSPRALDKGLAATVVGLARQGHRPMTTPRGAMEILNERTRLEFVIQTLAERAYSHSDLPPAEAERLRQRVRERAIDLLEVWARVAQDYQAVGTGLQYNPAEAGAAKQLLYDFLSPEVRNLPADNPRMKFRANRSLRDVEPDVNIWVRTLENAELEEETV
jgi:hypothetical protein